MATPLADMVGSPRSDVVPGFLMSPFSVEAFAQAEFEFARKHLEIVGAAAEACSDRIAEMMLRVANNEVANKQFTYGSTGFRVCCFSQNNIPLLFWLTLQPRHPMLTREEARKLITPANEAAVTRATLELIGYSFAPTPKKNPETNPPPTPPLTGETSSPGSASGESPEPKSPA